MLKPVFTSKFKKDFQKVAAQGKDMTKIDTVMIDLEEGNALEPQHKVHSLTGNFAGRRECHITPDWLLVYKIEDETIVFERTGSHSEIFK